MQSPFYSGKNIFNGLYDGIDHPSSSTLRGCEEQPKQSDYLCPVSALSNYPQNQCKGRPNRFSDLLSGDMYLLERKENLAKVARAGRKLALAGNTSQFGKKHRIHHERFLRFSTQAGTKVSCGIVSLSGFRQCDHILFEADDLDTFVENILVLEAKCEGVI